MQIRILKIITVTLTLITVVVGALSFGVYLYSDMILFPKAFAQQSEINQFEKLIFADLKTVEKYPLFKKNDFKKDSSEFLRDRIPLAGSKTKTAENKQNQIVQNLFGKYSNWATDKVAFKGLTSENDFAELDPKWLDKLKPFDHWTWTTHGEIQSILTHAQSEDPLQKIGSLSALPIPDYSLLRNWAAVYAIKKLQVKDLNAGLKIYRKVAELINSSGSLVAQMTAVAMLKTEHKLMNDFQARDWQLIPLQAIEAYRRLSWAWISLARQPFYSNLKVELSAYATPDFGVCAGATENMFGFFGARHFLEPQISFEKSYAENFRNAQVFEQKILQSCHLNDFTQMIELSSTAEPIWWLNGAYGFEVWDRFNWSRIPFIRRYFGLKLFLLSNFDTLNLYRNLASEKAKK